MNDGRNKGHLVCTDGPREVLFARDDRLLAVASDYADRGVQTVLINPNDAERFVAPGQARPVQAY